MTLLSLQDLSAATPTTRRLDHVGSFYSRSNRIIISDLDTNEYVNSTNSGSWRVYVERVITEPYSPSASLVLISQRLIGDPSVSKSIAPTWRQSSFKQVVIGSVAVFDEAMFVHANADERERKAFEDGWKYALASDGEGKRVKLVKGGVFCKTGIGDGRYRVDVGVEGGMVNAIQIDFASYTGDEFAARFAKDAAELRGAVPPDAMAAETISNTTP